MYNLIRSVSLALQTPFQSCHHSYPTPQHIFLSTPRNFPKLKMYALIFLLLIHFYYHLRTSDAIFASLFLLAASCPMGVIINIPSWRRDKFPRTTTRSHHCIHSSWPTVFTIREEFSFHSHPTRIFLLQSWFLFLLIPSSVTTLTIFIFCSFRLRGRYFFVFLFSLLVFCDLLDLLMGSEN